MQSRKLFLSWAGGTWEARTMVRVALGEGAPRDGCPQDWSHAEMPPQQGEVGRSTLAHPCPLPSDIPTGSPNGQKGFAAARGQES